MVPAIRANMKSVEMVLSFLFITGKRKHSSPFLEHAQKYSQVRFNNPTALMNEIWGFRTHSLYEKSQNQNDFLKIFLSL